MERITQLADLTYDELGRVRTTLVRRFRVTRGSNIRDISFGIAEKEHELDPRRSNSVLFYVLRKGNPGREEAPIPESVSIRLRRGKRYVLVELATDVLALASRARLNGKRIYFRGRSHHSGTAGCVVIWKRVGTHRFQWGVLTVSHIMPRGVSLPEPGTSIRLSGPLATQQGRLVAVSLGTRLDAALVEVSREQLEQTGILSPQQTTRGLQIRPRDTLANDVGATGYTRPVSGALPITVQAFTTEFRLLEDEFGMLADVVQVASRRGAFIAGTSGSLWSINRQVACMQFGQIGSSARGLGQPMERIVEWAAAAVASLEGLDRSQLDFRVVAAI